MTYKKAGVKSFKRGASGSKLVKKINVTTVVLKCFDAKKRPGLSPTDEHPKRLVLLVASDNATLTPVAFLINYFSILSGMEVLSLYKSLQQGASSSLSHTGCEIKKLPPAMTLSFPSKGKFPGVNVGCSPSTNRASSPPSPRLSCTETHVETEWGDVSEDGGDEDVWGYGCHLPLRGRFVLRVGERYSLSLRHVTSGRL
ncbi:hypothetical protein PsorP6_015873 [Peronosclerospora sorghi]|uniref:Uncharacterized protein n=1 Tax=Peronosclerospora sorghi TaxID=230839 RepID=A0ACC0WM93_9STRA|nr:hypothetical protein PsorP6_015873 [Peronosclerospora sorghi]